MRKGISVFVLAIVTIALAWGSLMVLATMRIERKVGVSKKTGEFPRREIENDAARKFHQLAVDLDLANREASRPATKARPALTDVVTIVNQAAPANPALPEGVGRFLDQHHTLVDEVREHLRRQPTLRWNRDDGALEKAPIPNLLEQMLMQKLLTADALSAEGKGDHERAWQTLEAQWALARAQWERPELICNLIALASTRLISGTARKINGPAPSWWHELAAFDVDRHLKTTMDYEKWRISQLVLTGPSHEGWQERLGYILRAPIERYQLSRALDYYAILGRIPIACAEPPANLPPFLPMSEMGLVRTRFARFILERELSTQVVAIREARRTGSPLPPVSTSRCGSWQVTMAGNQTSIHHTGPVPEVTSPVTPMPLDMTF